jgi:glycosyltransferase involved in cell wall biosynthesis
MVHEPFVPAASWKLAIMTTWQRWQLWMLGRTADVVFLSIEPWTRRFRSWFPGKPVLHLPVGSNIPLVPTPRAEARAALGIGDTTLVLGLFGTAHGSRLLGLVRSAVETACGVHPDAVVLYMGPHVQPICAAMQGLPVLAEGPLPAEEVSRRFAAVDICLAPFVDGVSTRRGSLMAGLQHGVATVGTCGPLTDDILQEADGHAFLLSDVGRPDDFRAHVIRLLGDGDLRERLGRGAQRLYCQEFAWNRIATRMVAAMQESARTS